MPEDALETALLKVWAENPAQGADGAHDLSHIRRVWQNAQRIAAAEPRPVDMAVLRAATVLHDLVCLPKDSPDRKSASLRSAQRAAPLLAGLGYEPGQIASISHAIEAHSYSAGITPQSCEAEILRDADRLDALGAIGIARTFAVSGQLRRKLIAADDPFCETRPPDDTAYGLDHFWTKLLRLHEGMCTPMGQTIAVERTQRMERFLEDLRQELGHIPQSRDA